MGRVSGLHVVVLRGVEDHLALPVKTGWQFLTGRSGVCGAATLTRLIPVIPLSLGTEVF